MEDFKERNRDQLLTQYKLLGEVAESEFDIQISLQKIVNEKEYRDLVLGELYELNHSEVIIIIDKINHILNELESEGIKDTNKKSNLMPFLMIAAGLVLFTLIGVGYFINQSAQVEQIHLVQSDNQNLKADTKLQLIESQKPALPADNPELTFKLHGSNTIGEKLAPALIKGYLTEQGVSEFYWVENKNKVERSLQYIKDNKAYVIELHAHGSSTAFKDLKSGQADLGMASRRVKNSEINDLSGKLGDLSKVGNEHIIGLDGLAIIVNQNNPIKQLSTKVLARIFSGEITNWSELGGEQKKINLFARDKNSGTWDTFKNLVLKKFNRKLANSAIRLESSSDLTSQVSQDEFAIGFIGLNYIQHNKALAISEGAGTKAIFPTRFTIGTEDYALSRRLYFYSPTSASNLVKDFAQFAISVTGQNIVEKTGLISQNIKIENVYPLADAPDEYNQYAQKAKRLSLNFRFNYSDKDLDNKGKRDLHRLIAFMENNVGRRLVLMGFSDSVGAKVQNQKLSLTRALSVERELSARGIPVMAVKGLGELLPVANNDTAAGRERNRRVEVWLL